MIFIRGARQLLTLRGPSLRRGTQLSELGIIPDGAALIDGETIVEIGSTRRVENLAAARSARVIDATGKVVLPGFVDSHARPIFAAPALRDFENQIAGTLDGNSAASKGGRPGSARSLGAISPKALRLRAQRWAQWAAAHGTTTMAARSGHGLALPSDLKGLRVARSLDGDPIELVPTFFSGGRHVSGLIDDPDAVVEQVTEVLLPLIRQRRLASICEVDCDAKAFDVKHCRKIASVAERLGFVLKVQARGNSPAAAVRLALETNAASVDHLLSIRPDEIDLLGDSSTVATVLPGVVYHRGGHRFAPARQLLDRGTAVALATGFDPGLSPTFSMPMSLSLACRQMKMSPAETIAAATINGAAALRRADRLGSLEPGKQADLAIFDVADYREIPYYFGVNLCVLTMKTGKVIYRAPGPAIPHVPQGLPPG